MHFSVGIDQNGYRQLLNMIIIVVKIGIFNQCWEIDLHARYDIVELLSLHAIPIYTQHDEAVIQTAGV